MTNYIKDKINELINAGWHSIRSYYNNSNNDWVLILQLGKDGMFLLPKVAEYRFSQAKWFDQYDNEIDESIDKIIAWRYLPNSITNIDKKIISVDSFINSINNYYF